MNSSRWVSLMLGLLLLPAALPALAQGPDYQIDGYTIAGGSGQSSGGDYSLGGTAGQAEANPVALTGNGYNLWPGFWQVIRGSGGPLTLYLPFVVKNQASGPDLVITGISVAGQSLAVTLRNQGNAAVTNAFWVDVYFNPASIPHLNQPWNTIAPAGAVWGVTTAIPAGGSLTLTVGDAWYFPQYSSRSFPTGAAVYGYVDSVNYATSYGNVAESNEANNLWPASGSTGVQAADSIGASTPGLPGR